MISTKGGIYLDKFDIEKFPTSESAKNMLHSISEDFYEKSYVMKWLLQVMGLEWDEAKRIIIEELPQQFFIETATWGLMFHEQKWQLPVRQNLSYEERRRLIYQRRDFKAPMTPYKMEIYLKNVTGFDVHVLDCHDAGEYGFIPEHPNIFKVIFIGEGTLDTKAARELLNKIKQSHTVYTIGEMVIVIVDHKELEQIQLRRLNLRTSFPFWKFNKDNAAIQRLECGVKCGVIPVTNNITNMVSCAMRSHHVIKEEVKQSLICLSTSFHDKTEEIATSQTLRTEVTFTESIEASVTTMKNVRYLDGSRLLDGSKQLNSEIKKEVL